MKLLLEHITEYPNFFITVTEGMRGYFAVIMGCDIADLQAYGPNFRTPYQSSFFSYSTPEEAEEDALFWSHCEDLPYIRSNQYNFQKESHRGKSKC